jgi:putative transposase
VHDGDVAAWVTDSTRTENFVGFLADLDAQTPHGMELHCIVDNLSTHFTPKVEEFLQARPRIFLHNTPTHASWLNQVELFFSILQRRLLRHGEFNSADDLAARVIAFIEDHNRRAPTVPLDLRRPPTHGRVTHNDLRARALDADGPQTRG